MRCAPFFALLLLGSSLAACAISYQPANFLGQGYSDEQLEPGYWRVVFEGNGYTNQETVQTYFLYRCAELALEQGYDGFDILSGIPLVMPNQPARRPVRLAANRYVPVIVPTDTTPIYIAYLQADIRLLKRPFETAPPSVFDAVALKNELEPLVQGPKCQRGNVCPYLHRYLFR